MWTPWCSVTVAGNLTTRLSCDFGIRPRVLEQSVPLFSPEHCFAGARSLIVSRGLHSLVSRNANGGAYHGTGSGSTEGLSPSLLIESKIRCSKVLEYSTRGVNLSTPHSSDKKFKILVCVYSPP